MKTSLNHSWEKLQSSSYLSPSSPSRSCPHCARVCTSRNPARPTLAFYNLSWTMTEKSTHKKPDFCRHSGNWVWKSWPGVLSQQLHKAVCFCVFGKLITLITLTNYQWAALCPTLLLFGVNCPHHQLLPEYPGWGLHHHCWAQGPEQGGFGVLGGKQGHPRDGGNTKPRGGSWRCRNCPGSSRAVNNMEYNPASLSLHSPPNVPYMTSKGGFAFLCLNFILCWL